MNIVPACGNQWTNREVAILAKMYATGTDAEIMAALPRRTWGAICRQANTLQYRRTRGLRYWLAAESYFIDRETMGPVEAQRRFTHGR